MNKYTLFIRFSIISAIISYTVAFFGFISFLHFFLFLLISLIIYSVTIVYLYYKALDLNMIPKSLILSVLFMNFIIISSPLSFSRSHILHQDNIYSKIIKIKVVRDLKFKIKNKNLNTEDSKFFISHYLKNKNWDSCWGNDIKTNFIMHGPESCVYISDISSSKSKKFFKYLENLFKKAVLSSNVKIDDSIYHYSSDLDIITYDNINKDYYLKEINKYINEYEKDKVYLKNATIRNVLIKYNNKVYEIL